MMKKILLLVVLFFASSILLAQLSVSPSSTRIKLCPAGYHRMSVYQIATLPLPTQRSLCCKAAGTYSQPISCATIIPNHPGGVATLFGVLTIPPDSNSELFCCLQEQ